MGDRWGLLVSPYRAGHEYIYRQLSRSQFTLHLLRSLYFSQTFRSKQFLLYLYYPNQTRTTFNDHYHYRYRNFITFHHNVERSYQDLFHPTSPGHVPNQVSCSTSSSLFDYLLISFSFPSPSPQPQRTGYLLRAPFAGQANPHCRFATYKHQLDRSSCSYGRFIWQAHLGQLVDGQVDHTTP